MTSKTGSWRRMFRMARVRWQSWLVHQHHVIPGCSDGAIIGALVGAMVGALAGNMFSSTWVWVAGTIGGGALGTLMGLAGFWDSLHNDWQIERELQTELDALTEATFATSALIERFGSYPLSGASLEAAQMIVRVCSKMSTIPSKEDSVKAWLEKASNMTRSGYFCLRTALQILMSSIDESWPPDLLQQDWREDRPHVENLLAILSNLPAGEPVSTDKD